MLMFAVYIRDKNEDVSENRYAHFIKNKYGKIVCVSFANKDVKPTLYTAKCLAKRDIAQLGDDSYLCCSITRYMS